MRSVIVLILLLGPMALAQGAKQAALLLKKGDAEAAAKAARTVLGKHPKDADAWLVLADALVAQGEPHEAWGELEKAIEALPDDNRLKVKLGDVFLKVAAKEQASGSDGTTIRSFYMDAERMYDVVLAADPKQAGALFGKAVANWSLSSDSPERLKAARELLAKCLQSNPDHAGAHAMQASLFYADGNAARKAGNEQLALEKFRAAQAKYEIALKLDQSDPIVYVRYGHCFYAQGKLDEAKKAYLSQLVHHPGNDTAIRSGLYYLGGRSWAKTVPYLKEAVEAAPKSWVAWYWYGWSLFSADKPGEAFDAFATANRLSPGNANTLYLMGFAQEKQDDAGKALEWYRKALEVNPDHTDCAARYEGIVLMSRNDIEEVEKGYEKLLKLAPNYGWGFNNYGLLLRNWCEPRGAARNANLPPDVRRRIRRSGEIYEKAAALLPDEAQIQSDTGLLFEFYPANFDANKARQYFTRALEISDYTYRDAFDGLNRLCRRTGDWETLAEYAEGVVGSLERGNQAVAPVGASTPKALPNETPGLLARARAAYEKATAELKKG